MSEAIANYRRVRESVLQQLAAGGDAAAIAELQSRGLQVAAPSRCASLDDVALRAVVKAWNDGALPTDRDQCLARAREALFELECRYRADSKVWARNPKGEPPQPPPAAPWLASRRVRAENWERPGGSKLYPSTADETRRRLVEISREVYGRST
ncbi:MAG: hypothetical protein AB7L71_07760 [Vicinamibacterales bacterium]